MLREGVKLREGDFEGEGLGVKVGVGEEGGVALVVGVGLDELEGVGEEVGLALVGLFEGLLCEMVVVACSNRSARESKRMLNVKPEPAPCARTAKRAENRGPGVTRNDLKGLRRLRFVRAGARAAAGEKRPWHPRSAA